MNTNGYTPEGPEPKSLPRAPVGGTGASRLDSISDMNYQPEYWRMLKDHIYAAQRALEIGIENSKELLAKYDTELGREHRSNRMTAERMEREIEQMEKALADIMEPSK